MKAEKKREKEQETLKLMVQLYCRGKHGNKKELCGECRGVLDYALMRTAKCPFMESKTFCSACKVHCYSKEMREQIKNVMKYSGPRMLLYHPVLAIWHIFVTLSEKRKVKSIE